jgi:hypothetical protein
VMPPRRSGQGNRTTLTHLSFLYLNVSYPSSARSGQPVCDDEARVDLAAFDPVQVRSGVPLDVGLAGAHGDGPVLLGEWQHCQDHAPLPGPSQGLAAVRLIPGVDEASISVVRDRQTVSSRLPTGDLPVRVDALQEETGQGPCLDAMYDQHIVRVSDMAHDQRWPRFAAAAAQAGRRACCRSSCGSRVTTWAR